MYYETPKYKPGNNSEVVSGSEKPETDHFLLFKKTLMLKYMLNVYTYLKFQ